MTTIDTDTLIRAARAVVATIDYEATFYAPEAQHPAEDWALDALQDALAGNTDEANAKIDRYDGAEWDERRAYPETHNND